MGNRVALRYHQNYSLDSIRLNFLSRIYSKVVRRLRCWFVSVHYGNDANKARAKFYELQLKRNGSSLKKLVRDINPLYDLQFVTLNILRRCICLMKCDR